MIVETKWYKLFMEFQLWVLPSLISLLLVIIAQYNFLTFHILAELFAIIICYLMFAVAYSTYEFSKNNILLILACGYLWIGGLDILHVLTYKGMNLFVTDTGNNSAQIWIISRYCEAFLLLAAPFLAQKKFKKNTFILIFAAITIPLAALSFTDYFPVAFIDGKGLTSFKVISEYIIITIFALALIALFRVKDIIPDQEKILIAAAIILTMSSEVAFTLYIDVYGLSNMLGHILKIFSYWFIFHAIILSALKRPYALLQENKRSLTTALIEAQNANKAKSDFLSNMSHDLRTPLNAIMGFSEAMRGKIFGPLGHERYEEYADDIYQSGEILIGFIDDLLDLSNVESGKYELKEEPLDINLLIGKSLQQIKQLKDTSKLSIKIIISDEMPLLWGDEIMIIQILNYVLSNAVQHTENRGDIKIDCRVNIKGSIEICITDTGIGMTENELILATMPFEQINSQLAKKYKGTGIGLYLCERFMETLQGRLYIKSDVEKGTEVTLIFPQKRAVYPATASL